MFTIYSLFPPYKFQVEQASERMKQWGAGYEELEKIAT